MTKLTVAALQLAFGEDTDANIRAGTRIPSFSVGGISKTPGAIFTVRT